MDIDYNGEEDEEVANSVDEDHHSHVNGIKSATPGGDDDTIDLSLVKDHWTAMGKDSTQSNLIHNMFFHMFIEHPHIRPIWAFNRTLSTKDAEWKTKLGNNHQFR